VNINTIDRSSAMLPSHRVAPTSFLSEGRAVSGAGFGAHATWLGGALRLRGMSSPVTKPTDRAPMV